MFGTRRFGGTHILEQQFCGVKNVGGNFSGGQKFGQKFHGVKICLDTNIDG